MEKSCCASVASSSGFSSHLIAHPHPTRKKLTAQATGKFDALLFSLSLCSVALSLFRSHALQVDAAGTLHESRGSLLLSPLALVRLSGLAFTLFLFSFLCYWPPFTRINTAVGGGIGREIFLLFSPARSSPDGRNSHLRALQGSGLREENVSEQRDRASLPSSSLSLFHLPSLFSLFSFSFAFYFSLLSLFLIHLPVTGGPKLLLLSFSCVHWIPSRD